MILRLQMFTQKQSRQPLLNIKKGKWLYQCHQNDVHWLYKPLWMRTHLQVSSRLHHCGLFSFFESLVPCIEIIRPMCINVNCVLDRYLFRVRGWRLSTRGFPGNSHLKPREYKYGALDQPSNPWINHINHFFLLHTKRGQQCCTQISRCYGPNTHRWVLFVSHFKLYKLLIVITIRTLFDYEAPQKGLSIKVLWPGSGVDHFLERSMEFLLYRKIKWLGMLALEK